MTRPRFTPTELQVSYDAGKTLTFYEIPNTVYGQPSYTLNDPVELQANFGSGLKTYFTGRIKYVEARGENHNEGVTYTAYGQHQLADDVDVVNMNGFPEFLVSASGYATSYGVSYYNSVRDAMTSLFSVNSTRLSSAGIPSSVDVTGISSIAMVTRDLSLRGGFYSAVRELASLDPGVKPFFDDVTQTWKFINVFNSPTLVLDVRSINLQSHSYAMSSDKKFTAVRLIDDGSEAQATQIYTPVNIGCYQISPEWDTSLQNSWTSDKGSHPLLQDGTSYNPYYDVYRTYRVVGRVSVPYNPSIIVPIEGGVPLPLDGTVQIWFRPYSYIASVTINAYPTDTSSRKRKLVTIISSSYGPSNGISEDDGTFTSVPSLSLSYSRVTYRDADGLERLVSVKVDQVIPIYRSTTDQYGTVVTTTAVSSEVSGILLRMSAPLAWGNLNVPGGALAPAALDVERFGVFATWFYASPATAELQPYMAFRYPTTGYTGTAYTVAGLEKEKIVYVKRSQLNVAYAEKLLAAASNLSVSAALPIEGGIMSEMLSLDRQIILKDTTKPTGIHSIAVPLVSYSYSFGKRGTSTLQISSDLKDVVN